jgi:hypothetical protein
MQAEEGNIQNYVYMTTNEAVLGRLITFHVFIQQQDVTLWLQRLELI